MIKAIIIEDEEKARSNLMQILGEYCKEVEVVAAQDNVQSGIKSIKQHNPDLLFLDVHMQGETGFDLLEQIGKIDFEIIFTTAHNEYAVKAFKFSAIDYLLKPIDINELVNAVQKATNKIEQNSTKERYDLIVENLQGQKSTFNKIALPTADGLVFVQLSDIIRCESEDNYTHFFLINGKRFLVSKTIKYFEELLTDQDFFRVHQSHLINIHHIKEYHKGEGGYAIMSDESSVIISRRKKEAFLAKLAI
ncbi:MAG: response regulator transcription factor [Flavobacteriales bacterium]|nr:response regulator transcription factor [Flavobacteriales bacterium]